MSIAAYHQAWRTPAFSTLDTGIMGLLSGTMLDRHVSHNRDRFTKLVDEEQEYFRWQSDKIDLLVSTLHDLGPGGTLADVGCFTGMATQAFRSTGFERAIGFDLSGEALKLAAARGIPPRAWRIGDEPCPAADSEFNVIVAADIIEHIVDTDAFLCELWRILKAAG